MREELIAIAEPARERRAARSPEDEELAARVEARIVAIGDRLRELHAGFDDGEPWDLPRALPEARELEPARGILASVAEPLAEWRALAQDPELERALAAGPVVSRPSLMVLRGWTNLLCWQAYLEALDCGGDPTGALVSALDLARAFDDGTCIGWMVRGAAERIVMDACRSLLEQRRLDPRNLHEALQGPLARIGCARAEELVENDVLQFLESVPEDASQEEFADSCSMYLHWPLAEDRGSAVRDALRLATDSIASQAALARLALAIEAHREEHGALPTSLDELAWAFPGGIPLDPLTEAPFAFTRDGAHARLGPSAWIEREPVAWDVACERLLAWEF